MFLMYFALLAQGAYKSGKPGNIREFCNSGKLREFEMYSGIFKNIICRFFHHAIYNKQHTVIYNLVPLNGYSVLLLVVVRRISVTGQSPCSLSEIFYYNLARNVPQ